MNQNTKVLITGAGGFIGSHLVERCVEAGFKVRAFVHYNSRNFHGWLEGSPVYNELEVVAGFSIYLSACNWKIMHENGPDAYHGPVVHNNFMQAVTYREQRESRSGVTKTDTARFRSTESVAGGARCSWRCEI